MYSITLLLALSGVASPAIALPSNMTSRQANTCVHCGTTSDGRFLPASCPSVLTSRSATLSDCQALVQPDTWNSVWAAGSNVCQYVSHQLSFFSRTDDAVSAGRVQSQDGITTRPTILRVMGTVRSREQARDQAVLNS
jgi:hypothetical protein